LRNTGLDLNQMKLNEFPQLMSRAKTCRILCLLAMFILSGLTSYGQVRKSIYGAKRKIRTEINRTKRDFRGLDKALSSNKRTVDSSLDTADVIMWSMKPHIPNSGMIHDYQYVYNFLHTQQEYTFPLDYDLKSIEWDSINNLFYKNIGGSYKLDDNVEVIGWHPHWMGDAYKYYNYKLLSMISFYSYDIDPYTGSYWNPEVIEQLRNSSLPDSAAKYGTKLLISVTSLDKEYNSIFLGNELAQDQFIYEILELLREREGMFAGIDLNFEEIDPDNRDDFTHFVKKLNAQLINNDYMLILDVPYFNDGNVLDYNELKNHVVYFNIMGYDFSGVHSTYPGSISPLQAMDTQPSLETSVNDFFNDGIDGQQIILSLPLYGVTWDITNLEKGNVSFYEKSLPYYQVISNYETEYNPYYDAFSSSFFFVINENGRKMMCWYENEISLEIKFRWAKEKNLKGIGLWALGYSQGAPEIWQGVADNFGADSLVVISPVSSELSGPYGIVRDIIKYKKVIGLGFLVFAGFVVLGFVLSLKDWRVREILFQKQSFRVVYSLVFITLVVFGIQWLWTEDHLFQTKRNMEIVQAEQFQQAGELDKAVSLYESILKTYPAWNLIIGIVFGAIAVLLINMAFTRYRKLLK